MFRILFFLILVLALAFGFAWLADRPGDMVITFGDMRIELTLMVAAVALVGAVAAVMVTWWVIKGLWNSPHTVRRYFRARKRDRGYQSLSTGMIAAGAGDTAAARLMVKQAAGLLAVDQEPLIKLLDAQTTLLEGDHDGARGKFEAMLDDPETRLLGLRGLYLEAERVGNREAAHEFAERAVEINPQLGWAGTAALQLKTLAGNWDGALQMLEGQRRAGLLAKPEIKRRRAVLLTARAMNLLESNPAEARNAAAAASKLAPDLVPAAVTAAEAMVRLGELRKAASLLERAWKKQAHPEIANAYVHARAGDSAQDRLKRARKLQTMRTNNPESQMAVAQAALAAGEYREAREALDAVIRTGPRESAWLLLADVEEAETGDQGRVRAWLAKAVRAPRDPAWTADGYVSERWLPASPVTGEIDAFQWKIPVEQIAPVVDAAKDIQDARPVDPAELAVPIMPPPKEPEPDEAQAEADAVLSTDVAEDPEPEVSDPQDEQAAAPVEEAAQEDDVAEAEIVSDAPAPEQVEPPEQEKTPEHVTEAEDTAGSDERAETDDTAVPDDAAVPVGEPDVPDETTDDESGETKLPLPRPPDDPGLDPDAEPDKPRRFRLF